MPKSFLIKKKTDRFEKKFLRFGSGKEVESILPPASALCTDFRSSELAFGSTPSPPRRPELYPPSPAFLPPSPIHSRFGPLLSPDRLISPITEPILSAVTPFTPLLQPLALRYGYYHDLLHSLPYYERSPFTPLHPMQPLSPLQPLDLKTRPLLSQPSPRKPDLPTEKATLAVKKEPETSSQSPNRNEKKVNAFQDGVTVGYTYDAFFVSDGRSRKRNSMGIVSGSSNRITKYSCNECGKQYATSSNLSRHKQTHRSLDSQQAKKCPHCSKVYVSMPALSMHILTHSLKHKCNVCGKTFSRPWLLQGHLRSHTGEKPYGCAHCGKAFADRSNLRAHMQTHSSFKHYECNRCHKTFALKSYLNKHHESSCIKEESIPSPRSVLNFCGSNSPIHS